MDSFKSGDMFVKLQIRPPFTSLLEKVTSNNVFVISSAKGVSYLHPFTTRGKNVSVRGTVCPFTKQFLSFTANSVAEFSETTQKGDGSTHSVATPQLWPMLKPVFTMITMI